MHRTRIFTLVATGAFIAACAARSVPAESAFAHLSAAWARVRDYSVLIHAHEQLGSESDEHEIYYAFRKDPQSARLDVVEGTKSGATIVWTSGDGVTAYKRAFSFLKMHGGTKDRNLTSLRGNGILMPNIGDLIECFDRYRGRLREAPGPVVGGVATDEVSLPYTGIVCPDDSATDAAVTLDTIDVSRESGLIVERTRYQGADVVERWTMRDYKVNAGLTDDALR